MSEPRNGDADLSDLISRLWRHGRRAARRGAGPGSGATPVPSGALTALGEDVQRLWETLPLRARLRVPSVPPVRPF
jgi:hypothetical protein